MTIREEDGRTKESTGDTANLSQTSNSESLDTSTNDKSYSRLPQPAIQKRIDECIDLRYKADIPILQREWVEHCKVKYGDKSVPQYINYWVNAKEQYEEKFRGMLDNLIEPAIQGLREGLSSDNHYVRSKTIDQIWKMSGNDIQKHHVLTQQIQVGFTPTEED
tara:strand:- start:152 stop:640 length:489 start_codon:yes stop_codon:yes gene_type:complete